MGSALWAGISGLNSSSKQLDVIANNLANVNTVGFKSGTTYFADVLSQSLSGGSGGNMQVGRGVAVTEVQTQFSAGSFESTGNATDVAIDGDGFFMVNDSEGATYYTRAGSFHLDKDSMLVDVNGYNIQGKEITAGVPGALGNIDLHAVQSEPSRTTEVSLGANLNSQTENLGQYTTTQTVFDSLGGSHTLNTVFTKQAAANTWTAAATIDQLACTIGGAATAAFTFDVDGNMTAPVADLEIDLVVPPTAYTLGPINWDLAGTSALKITQYSSSSVIRAVTADGYASGQLKNLSINQEGIISGFFTNGQTSELAQLVLAKFANPWGLNKLGSNLFGQTVTSGPPIQNDPGSSGMGQLTPNTLEMSNTDIATEFIKMITAQKAYQSSARVVTTQDTIMQELMNLKRS